MTTAKRKTIGIWGWVWRSVVGFVALILLLFVTLLGFYTKHCYDQAAFDKKPLSERNLIVFDAVVKAVNNRYYDSTFGGVDWAKVSQEARAKAADARTTFELYSGVLGPLLKKLPASHVGAQWPEADQVKPATAGKSVPVLLHRGKALPDYGFDLVPIRRHNRYFDIVGDVRSGTPAEVAGIEPGWALVYGATSYNTITNSMRFEGKFLPITADIILRSSRPQAFQASALRSIAYDMPFREPPSPFEAHTLANGVRYIRFDNFKSGLFSSPLMDRVLVELDKAGPEGVILDLRNNGGGDEYQCERFLSHFLPRFANIGTTNQRKHIQTLYTNFWSHRYKGSSIVLIGPSTGSAAELATETLKYYRRAIVIGRVSNGSVLLSKVITLPDGGHIQLPIKDYLGPDGQRIESVGVVPDIEIIPTLADIRAGRDPVLERAEAILAHK